MKAIILAGGVGTRLWPLSRTNRPKQFTSLISEEPLLSDTYRRLLRLFAAEDIFFSTSPAFAEKIAEMFPEVPAERIIVEPAKRDTGPAMGYVAAYMSLVSPDEPMVFVPSDHYVRDVEIFLTCLRTAGMLVEQTGKMLNIALKAEFPSTVLGYLKVGEKHDEIDGVEIYHFAGQTEKPSYEIAKEFLEDGSYMWNGNYFTWTPRKFLEAFSKYAPEIGDALSKIRKMLQTGDHESAAEVFETIEPVSLDYAVGEKIDHDDVLVIKGDFGWSDIGAWDTLHARLAEDTGESNIVRGDAVLIDAEDNIIYTDQEKLISILGVSGLVVVDTGDALLVTTKEHAQRVKEVVAEIKSRGADHLL